MGLLGLGLKLKNTLKAKKVSPTITKIAPTISKNLSDTTRAKKIQGFLSNLRKKELKDFEKTKKVSEIKKSKKTKTKVKHYYPPKDFLK